jgi:hypothetical protein
MPGSQTRSRTHRDRQTALPLQWQAQPASEAQLLRVYTGRPRPVQACGCMPLAEPVICPSRRGLQVGEEVVHGLPSRVGSLLGWHRHGRLHCAVGDGLPRSAVSREVRTGVG